MSAIAKKFFIASLIYLVIGLLSQAVAIFDVWLGFNPLAYTAIAATEQILLVGWLTQLALALIYERWLSPTKQEIKPSSIQNPKPKVQNPKPKTCTACPEHSRRERSRSIQNPKPVLSKVEVSKIQNPKSSTGVFLLFNIGLPLVIVGQPGLALFGGQWLGAAAAFGGLLQLFAGLLFVYDVWRTLNK
jgi:hypothetical protein